MKQFVPFLFVLFSITTVIGQTRENRKIKIVLLGTMHFTPSSQDSYKNEALNISGSKRQKEIQEVVQCLSAFRPNQICIEVPVSEQLRIDSNYTAFLNRTYKLEQDEIDQLAFQTAKQLNLKRLTCVNYMGRFETDSVSKFAKEKSQEVILKNLDVYVKDFLRDLTEKQNTLALSDYLVYLNSKIALNKNLSLYTNYYTRIGQDQNYVGTDVVADWYNTNLHIYTNILRSVKPDDKAILVLFGQGHIPILKHLFESNPDYEVVEVNNVIKIKRIP